MQGGEEDEGNNSSQLSLEKWLQKPMDSETWVSEEDELNEVGSGPQRVYDMRWLKHQRAGPE